MWVKLHLLPNILEKPSICRYTLKYIELNYVFCSIKSSYELSKATNIYPEQIGFEWQRYDETKDKTVYPEVIKIAFDQQGNMTTPVYIGDTF